MKNFSTVFLFALIFACSNNSLILDPELVVAPTPEPTASPTPVVTPTATPTPTPEPDSVAPTVVSITWDHHGASNKATVTIIFSEPITSPDSLKMASEAFLIDGTTNLGDIGFNNASSTDVVGNELVIIFDDPYAGAALSTVDIIFQTGAVTDIAGNPLLGATVAATYTYLND